ncbi:dTDP-4-amino-4,6-dideoxygalactose transaminase [Marinomonas primoryensis]|jgi:dTDP-4-amino-4,6-dideoxygalactose transaminase|uniref:dTDP-4-amino-4,6-dideoxygalactose transaminase n=1 Tax=Marinomonas primoryensis TaxID=178399 RepID=UPI003704AA7B|tara:strand:- start:5207 stop:6352 length:1146 start_codon:yes stop_codon:yes gene_type:complete
MHIGFNKPPLTGNEQQYVLQAMQSDKISGDAYFGKKCQKWFESNLGCKKTLLTPSCTAALEMAAILIDIQPGDEVIMPSYTFVSTANAFVLRGAKIVFVDIRPDTMNIDETLIEAAITNKTRAIVPVHYAGVSCEMDTIMSIADQHGLFVIEDAAQGVMSTYKGRALGTLGHLAAYSFHETKNYTSGGEGGLLIINDDRFLQRAEIIREKGTNRSMYFQGQVDKYTWVDLGSSFLPSELQAAYLWGQLEKADMIKEDRLETWSTYNDAFQSLKSFGVELPTVPNDCQHNGHMFYLKLRDIKQREEFIKYLKTNQIVAVFHYIPLHSAPAAKDFTVFTGNDNYTTSESERLVRLPMYYGMERADLESTINLTLAFFKNSGVK